MKYSLILLLLFTTAAHAKTWLVGPARQYTVPSAVMNLVADGDTVLVDSGTYVGDVATWTNNNLMLRCPDGMARFNANGKIADLKGIWVVYGKNTYVEGFEFYGAAIDSADGDNGAGIRVQGNNFTCRRCYFHDNQEGILTGNDTAGNDILIEACEFDHNGVENGGAAGFEHNIYIGLCSTCTIKFCSFTRSIVGHELKCRANVSYILYNYIVDGPTGDGSLSIDIPQGGLAFVMGNIIEKGPMTANSTVIGYGEEGFKNPDTDFYFINNTVVTDRNPTTYFEIAAGTKTALIANNIFAGVAHPIVGFTDSEANTFNADTSFFHFKNSSLYDYHLTTFVPGATQFQDVNGFSITPLSEYFGTADSAARPYISEGGALATIAIANDFVQSTCVGESDTALLIITNSGIGAGILPLFAPDNNGEFSIINEYSSTTISPGEIDTALIIFKPQEVGQDFIKLNPSYSYMGNIQFIPIQATGSSAIISGSGTVSSPVDQSQSFPVKVCNTGTCDWTPGIPICSNSAFLYVRGGITEIPAEGCDSLVFTFTPTSAGAQTDTLSFPNAAGISIPAPNVILVGTGLASGVTEASAKCLSRNFPNPFSSETLFPNISGFLRLFNILGNEIGVATEQTENGILLDRGNLPAAIYFYRITEAERGTVAEGSVVIGN
jgi:hypothetical protein